MPENSTVSLALRCAPSLLKRMGTSCPSAYSCSINAFTNGLSPAATSSDCVSRYHPLCLTWIFTACPAAITCCMASESARSVSDALRAEAGSALAQECSADLALPTIDSAEADNSVNSMARPCFGDGILALTRDG